MMDGKAEEKESGAWKRRERQIIRKNGWEEGNKIEKKEVERNGWRRKLKRKIKNRGGKEEKEKRKMRMGGSVMRKKERKKGRNYRKKIII